MNEQEDRNHDEEEQVFIIADQNGQEHEMIMVYSFAIKEQQYAVLLDRNHPEEDGVVFRIETEDENSYLVGIEDEQEWERVVSVYNEIVAQEQGQ